jgi:hydroxymethylpyrimidine pyrophosphatase-like HAD family hydrolase
MYRTKTKIRMSGLQLLSDVEAKKRKKITFMINSGRYLLNYVMVVFEDLGYRLVVNRSGDIITDKIYETLKGAKIAFLKFHHFLAHNEEVKPIWSHVYVPEEEWLREKLQLKLNENKEMETGGMDE